MAKDPTFPLYAQDFLVDTIQLPENLVGAYIRLLCVLWINGKVNGDANSLAMISPLVPEVIELLKEKFTFHLDGTITNNRLEEIRAERVEYRRTRSEAGIKGAKNRWQKNSTANGQANGKANGKKIAKENEKENEKEVTKELEILTASKEVKLPWATKTFKEQWKEWKNYRLNEHEFEYKSSQSEQSALKELSKLSEGDENIAISIMHKTMANGWKGFEYGHKLILKKENYGNKPSRAERILSKYQGKGIIS